MNKDPKGPKILARTFFNQLRASGYSQNQIIGIATELIDLVATDIKDGDKTPLPPLVEQVRHTA